MKEAVQYVFASCRHICNFKILYTWVNRQELRLAVDLRKTFEYHN